MSEQSIKLIQGDCLEVMATLPDNSIDAIITDPPYGTTACKWDAVIPLEPMWEQLKRIIKPSGAIVLFGSQPFTSALIMSNVKMFKYCWVWVKDKATNHLNAKKQPMRKTEDICIFYDKQCLYTPQFSPKPKWNIRPDSATKKRRTSTPIYGEQKRDKPRKESLDTEYPNQILLFNNCSGVYGGSHHPTQKPIKLMEYLVKTYTLEGEIVLDFTMGSGSTGVACKNTGREFIGIEQDAEYVAIAKKRINASVRQLELF
jgi:site-specific DNA-methyltransferase (adenine-specific)